MIEHFGTLQGIDQRADDRQAKPNAALAPRSRTVDAVEALEDPVRLRRRHTGSLVGNLEHDLLVLGREAHVDRCRGRSVDARVGQQVVDDLPQARLGAENDERTVRLELDRSPPPECTA
jgi:hypothetical protein